MKNTEIKNTKITAKIRTAMSVLAVCMLLGLAACSGMESETEQAEAEAQEQEIEQWAESLGLSDEGFTPLAGEGNTVATATVTPDAQQVLYLWEEGNAPAVTEYTVNNGGYFDDPDFRTTSRMRWTGYPPTRQPAA